MYTTRPTIKKAQQRKWGAIPWGLYNASWIKRTFSTRTSNTSPKYQTTTLSLRISTFPELFKCSPAALALDPSFRGSKNYLCKQWKKARTPRWWFFSRVSFMDHKHTPVLTSKRTIFSSAQGRISSEHLISFSYLESTITLCSVSERNTQGGLKYTTLRGTLRALKGQLWREHKDRGGTPLQRYAVYFRLRETGKQFLDANFGITNNRDVDQYSWQILVLDRCDYHY